MRFSVILYPIPTFSLFFKTHGHNFHGSSSVWFPGNISSTLSKPSGVSSSSDNSSGGGTQAARRGGSNLRHEPDYSGGFEATLTVRTRYPDGRPVTQGAGTSVSFSAATPASASAEIASSSERFSRRGA